MQVWRTNADRSQLLTHERLVPSSEQTGPRAESIVIQPAKRYQSVDGFGFALTGGSAQLLHRMTPAKRRALLQQIFGRGTEDFGVSYLRVSIGASDMNDHVFTYDDLPVGETDTALARFSLREDEVDVIPVLREILAISPGLQIIASPWTAPSWMKTQQAAKGGTLRPEYYAVYAAYLVRYLQEMHTRGVPIAAVTMQNEPLNPKNTPSMVLDAEQEGRFLRDAFGPALRNAGLKTRVVLYDHNCDRPDYPLAILRDPAAASFADGSGFHLYEGDVSAMSAVHEAFPGKNVYFTEQMVVEHQAGGVSEPVARPVARIVIGAMRNWSRTVVLWNLAADAKFGPHTSDGGCPVCQGAITIEGDDVTLNIAMYAVAHASKFVPPGSIRIDSSEVDRELGNVAWQTPKGRYVLLVTNNGSAKKEFDVVRDGARFSTSMEAGTVATFVW